MTTDAKVIQSIETTLGVTVAFPDSRIIEDLGADSLDCMEIVMDLEIQFSIEITDAEAEKVVTVQDAINVVQGKLKTA